MRGQAVAVSLVMGCGLAMLIMARSLIASLEFARESYYQAHHFADAFARFKRAPLSLLDDFRRIPGLAEAEAGVGIQVTLDIPGLEEPASGMVHSLPERGDRHLNRLFLRHGRWIEPDSRGEVLVGEAFAEANSLTPGSQLKMILNGKLQQVRVAGIVLSPEYVFEARPGSALPDNRTYGIFWMPYRELASSYQLYGAMNEVAIKFSPGASERGVLEKVDQLLEPYGGRGAYARKDHPSHIRVTDEIRVLQILSIGFPVVFLGVAAFMTHAVLSRLLNLQREQIAILKAFGFSEGAIAGHYLKFAFVFVAAGACFGVLGGIGLGNALVQMYHMFFRFPALEFRLDAAAVGWACLVGVAAASLGVLGSIRKAAGIPPAEAMRPEPPASFRPSIAERLGLTRWIPITLRIALRNLERKPLQALLTAGGLALATGILIIPNAFRDSVQEVLEFQWDVIQRQDVSLGLVEPESSGVVHALSRLPGVVSMEVFRYTTVRVRSGRIHRQVLLEGLDPDDRHMRAVDKDSKLVRLPAEGIVLSSKLAEVLGVRLGDLVQVEALEGRRRIIQTPVVGLSEEFAGIIARMDRRAVNRLMGEGDWITGASFLVDRALWRQFLAALKETPRASWVVIKQSLRDNFRKTTAASINLIQSIYLTFATVVAFGVVYNNTRISLAERSRELATLRVIGFSQREVGSVLVLELLILALIATPIGLLLGTGFAHGIIGAVNTETVRLPLVLSLRNYTFAAAVVAAASFISAFFVLRSLNRIDLAAALKAPE